MTTNTADIVTAKSDIVTAKSDIVAVKALNTIQTGLISINSGRITNKIDTYIVRGTTDETISSATFGDMPDMSIDFTLDAVADILVSFDGTLYVRGFGIL